MKVPIAISARHIHLCQKDLEILFGPSYQLTNIKDLKQKGEFASKETVSLKGPKVQLDEVRIVGPIRKQTQVEVTKTDARRLGIVAPVRISGQLENSADILVIGLKGQVELKQRVIIPQRHIHLSQKEAEERGLKHNQIVSVKVEGERSLTFHQVIIRIADHYQWEMHIDTDEANAAGIDKGAIGEVII